MRVVVPLWLVVLTVVSLVPDPIKYHLGTKGSFHYAAHFLVFVATGLIFCWKSASLRSRLAAALAGCCAALVLELLEAQVYGNPIEWSDVWIGCLGVSLGFAAATIAHGIKMPAVFVRK
jgi:uncharacterized membrane protein YjjB (DUF3815 family)